MSSSTSPASPESGAARLQAQAGLELAVIFGLVAFHCWGAAHSGAQGDALQSGDAIPEPVWLPDGVEIEWGGSRSADAQQDGAREQAWLLPAVELLLPAEQLAYFLCGEPAQVVLLEGWLRGFRAPAWQRDVIHWDAQLVPVAEPEFRLQDDWLWQACSDWAEIHSQVWLRLPVSIQAGLS
jgi:hypothetical protein